MDLNLKHDSSLIIYLAVWIDFPRLKTTKKAFGLSYVEYMRQIFPKSKTLLSLLFAMILITISRDTFLISPFGIKNTAIHLFIGVIVGISLLNYIWREETVFWQHWSMKFLKILNFCNRKWIYRSFCFISVLCWVF